MSAQIGRNETTFGRSGAKLDRFRPDFSCQRMNNFASAPGSRPGASLRSEASVTESTLRVFAQNVAGPFNDFVSHLAGNSKIHREVLLSLGDGGGLGQAGSG